MEPTESVESPVTNFADASTPTHLPTTNGGCATEARDEQATQLETLLPPPNLLARLRISYRWYRVLHALRWKLSTDFFGKPLPLLTANLDLKLGDLVITLPVVGGLLAWCAVELAQLHTKNNGGPAQIAMGLAFVLSVRNNSLLLALTGLSFERAILYHKLFGFVAFVTSSMHGLSYLLKHHQVYGSAGVARNVTQDDLDDASGSAAVSGAVAYFPLAALFLLSFSFIRRRFFDFFLRMHWVLFIAIIVGSLLHNITLAYLGAAIWGVDALYRLVYLPRLYKHGSSEARLRKRAQTVNGITATNKKHDGVAAPSQVRATKLSSDIVRIQFPTVRADTGERFLYEPGQFAFLCVPQLSLLQWHPFSISSMPHESFVTFHVKVLGDWTSKLLKLVERADQSGGEGDGVPLEIFLDGPVGQVALDIDAQSQMNYSYFVLLAGGIGVTPMKAIVNQLHFDYSKRDRHALQRVHFVWSVRDREMLEAFLASPEDASSSSASYFPDQLLKQQQQQSPNRPPVFTTEIFLTKGERDLEHPVGDTSMRYGSRPNVREILRSVGKDAKLHGRERVAVLACGPHALTNDVITASIELSTEMHVRFDVHTEKFEF